MWKTCKFENYTAYWKRCKITNWVKHLNNFEIFYNGNKIEVDFNKKKTANRKTGRFDVGTANDKFTDEKKTATKKQVYLSPKVSNISKVFPGDLEPFAKFVAKFLQFPLSQSGCQYSVVRSQVK